MAAGAHREHDGQTPQDEERIRGEVVVERELTNQHRRLQFTVPKGHAPPSGSAWRIDRYLHALLPTISRTVIQRWVEQGAATVNGAPCRPQYKLRALDVVELLAPLPDRDDPAAEAATPVRILHRDRWLLVVDKPPGQLAHQAGRIMTGTLVNQLADLLSAEGGDPRSVRLVNRIDRDTSGIVLASLDVTAHAATAKAMEARQVRKEYLALVTGVPEPAEGFWREPIGASPEATIARVVRADGQQCLTGYTVLETAPEGAYALVRLRLHTGRQHQIRVHAAHHGHALIGDWVYGRPCRELPGQALHATLLAFVHPMTHETLTIEAPLPPLLDSLWHRLRAGGRVEPTQLSETQRSKLSQRSAPGVRRPSWLSAEDYQELLAESGEGPPEVAAEE